MKKKKTKKTITDGDATTAKKKKKKAKTEGDAPVAKKKKKSKKGADGSAQSNDKRARLEAHQKAVKEMGVKILTASKIKEYFKYHDVRIDPKLTSALAHEVYGMMLKAVKRVQENARKTARPHDL